MFDVNYRQMKQNPLYASDPDMRRGVESSPPRSDSPEADDDLDAPAKRRPVESGRPGYPNYNEVTMCTKPTRCTHFFLVVPRANSAFHPSGVGK